MLTSAHQSGKRKFRVKRLGQLSLQGPGQVGGQESVFVAKVAPTWLRSSTTMTSWPPRPASRLGDHGPREQAEALCRSLRQLFLHCAGPSGR